MKGKRRHKATDKNTYLYIPPKLEIIKSIDESNDSEIDSFYSPRTYLGDYKEIFRNIFTIILADPGNGKSRLLKEITRNASQTGQKAIYLDLKRLGDSDIENKITNILSAEKVQNPETNEEINSIKDYFYTENFQLNSTDKNIILCLDALDEVKNELTFEIIEKVKSFNRKFGSVKIILSCRENIFQRYSISFAEFTPKLIKIAPFNVPDVKRFLTAHKFSKTEIEQVITRFFVGYQLRIISSPRILEIFIKLRSKIGLDQTINKSKAELLEHFIYSELTIEEMKFNKDYSSVKRVLEKLALTMSIYQTTIISKDELMTFFDDIDSSLSNSILTEIRIDGFCEKTVLIVNDDKVQFENKEFQEYLTAKEIVRLGRVEQVTFDLMVDKQIRELYFFWCNSLKYLLEIKPDLQGIIIDFICRRDNFQAHSLIPYFIIEDPNRIALISETNRKLTFQNIFKSYQNNKWYLFQSLAERLALYFAKDMEGVLKEYADPTKSSGALFENTILIACYLWEPICLLDTQYWTDLAIRTLGNKSSSNSAKKYSIRLLSKRNDIGLLENSFDYKAENDSSVLYEFARACQEVAPNSIYTIEYIIYLVKDRSINIAPRPDFEKVTSLTGIRYFLSHLNQDREFYNRYVFNYNHELYVNQVIKNIERVYNIDIENLLIAIILKSSIDNERFIAAVFELLLKKAGDLLSKVLKFKKALTEDNSEGLNFYQFEPLFMKLLSIENVDIFIEKVEKFGWNKNELIHFFWFLQFSEEKQKKEIFERSKKYYSKEYNEILESQKNQNNTIKKENREVGYYEQFKYLLEPEKGKFATRIFEYYNHHRESINKFIQEEDKARMIDLLTNTVLKFDFSEVKVTVEKITETSKRHLITESVIIFSHAIPVFSDFGIDITKHRKLLLEYLPYSFDFENNLDKVFKLVGDLNEREIDKLVNFYSTKRDDDLIQATLGNFFMACRYYKIIKVLPILKGMVLNESAEGYNRLEAINLINELAPDIEFYKKTFDEYINKPISPIQERLIERANSFLIKNENQYKLEAIIWRMKRITEKPTEYINPEDPDEINPHRIGSTIDQVNEYGPLLEIVDIKYKNLFINLLKDAIDIFNMGKQYRSYAVYIWSITFAYYNKLISLKNFDPILELERVILSYSKWEGFQLLKGELNRVKANYLNSIGKPDSYAESIEKYNALRRNRYLTISSPEELCLIVQNIIDIDIKKWVEKEGAYRFMSGSSHGKVIHREELIQKTLKSQFELSLMRRGIRENETTIRREEQLLDNKRTDFVISYGFIGQILIEIKLTSNKDIKDPNYPDKIIQYIDGTKSDYGIYLIFQVDNKNKWDDLERGVMDAFKVHTGKVIIKGLDCR